MKKKDIIASKDNSPLSDTINKEGKRAMAKDRILQKYKSVAQKVKGNFPLRKKPGASEKEKDL